MPITTIAPPSKAVKRTPDTRVRDPGTQEPGQPTLPDVLGKMPPSCRAVFAAVTALASQDRSIKTTVSELARRTRYSRRQTHRALIRLHAAHLIRWQGASRGRGSVGTVELRWATFPQGKWASKSQADYAVGKQTPEAPIYSENINTKERVALVRHTQSPSNWEEDTSSTHTHQTVAARPVWPDGPGWCTRRLWALLAGRVRRRATELWGPYGTTATDAILSTAARAVRASLIEGEEELREFVRHLGGRLRESGHAIEVLSDRPRAFAFLGGVARRWLRRRGRLQEPAPEGMSATDWPKWRELAFEVLDQLNWAWERREKPLADVTGIVGKVARAWVETPPGRLHRRAWELLEAVSLRGFDLEESRWLVIAGLAGALGTSVPEPPQRPRDPFARRLSELQEQGYTEQEARARASREFLGGLIWA